MQPLAALEESCSGTTLNSQHVRGTLRQKVSRAIETFLPWTLHKRQREDESFRLQFWLIDWAAKLLAGAERVKNEI